MREGWTKLAGANRRHYFRKYKSLCGVWHYRGLDDFDRIDDHENNCIVCVEEQKAKKWKDGREKKEEKPPWEE